MDLRAIGTIPESIYATLAPIVARHGTLERVVHWGLAARPICDITEILQQDEYTLDVILPVPGEPSLFLVYDTT